MALTSSTCTKMRKAFPLFATFVTPLKNAVSAHAKAHEAYAKALEAERTKYGKVTDDALAIVKAGGSDVAQAVLFLEAMRSHYVRESREYSNFSKLTSEVRSFSKARGVEWSREKAEGHPMLTDEVVKAWGPGREPRTVYVADGNLKGWAAAVEAAETFANLKPEAPKVSKVSKGDADDTAGRIDVPEPSDVPADVTKALNQARSAIAKVAGLVDLPAPTVAEIDHTLTQAVWRSLK